MHINSLRWLSSQYLVVVVDSELYCARLIDNLGLWCVRVGRMRTLRNNFSPNLSFYRGRNIGPRRLVGGSAAPSTLWWPWGSGARGGAASATHKLDQFQSFTGHDF